MTTSPYDNLPTGKKEESADTVQYEEVQPEMQETSDQSETLHYVDVEVEEAPPIQEAAAKPEASPAPIVKAMPIQPTQRSVDHAPTQTPAPPQAFMKTTPFDKPPRYSTLSVKNLRDAKEYILPFEESLLVPDTMPDMERLLFAEGSVRTAQPQKQSYDKDDFLAGDITVYTVYQPMSENHSPVDVVKSIIPFKTDKCWGDAEDATFRAEVAVKSISAEMVNERKFIVKGELLIKLTEIMQQDIKLFQGTDDADFIQAERGICITDLDFTLYESTDISQDINIRENQPAPIKILKESIHIIENHRQITSGKLVINASIHSQVLYLGEEDGEKKLSCLTNKTDFTQFVLVKEGADADLIRITFLPEDLKISIENQNMFLLKGTVSAAICGYKNRELNIVHDAYHKSRDITFDASSRELSCLRDTVAGEISSREVISLSEADEKPEVLVCGCGQLSAIDARRERDRIIIEGAVSVKILALNEEGKPFIIESSLPLRGSLETKAAGSDLKIYPSAALKDMWFDEINSRQLEINVSVAINVHVWGREVCITLENLCFAETPDPQPRISMAIYVTEQNDTLWNVAKRYKSDVAAIAELNQLDAQKPLTEGMKLFIMG